MNSPHIDNVVNCNPEVKIDFYKMVKIVLDAGYNGYIDVEYEGSRLTEDDGIIATKKLLEKVRLSMV